MSVPGYSAWSVTAGEQPTTAYWNILGSNDAAFNTMLSGPNTINGNVLQNASVTGVQLASYLTQRNNNGANVIEQAAIIQTGWVAVHISGSQTNATSAVTFPIPYTNVPIVIATFGGDTAGNTSTLGAGGANVQAAMGMARSVTTTGASITANTGNSSNTWPSGTTVYIHWFAIGV